MRLKCEAAQASRLLQPLQTHRQTVFAFSNVAKMFKEEGVHEVILGDTGVELFAALRGFLGGLSDLSFYDSHRESCDSRRDQSN